jgi:hypothetical protein
LILGLGPRSVGVLVASGAEAGDQLGETLAEVYAGQDAHEIGAVDDERGADSAIGHGSGGFIQGVVGAHHQEVARAQLAYGRAELAGGVVEERTASRSRSDSTPTSRSRSITGRCRTFSACIRSRAEELSAWAWMTSGAGVITDRTVGVSIGPCSPLSPAHAHAEVAPASDGDRAAMERVPQRLASGEQLAEVATGE